MLGNVARMSETATAKRPVVIIDDHTAFAEAMGLALSLSNDLICVATSPGTEPIVELHDRHRPALIVSDYHIRNGPTGLESAGALRSSGNRTPIMLLTGWPTPSVITAARDIENLEVVSKSTPMRELVDLMRRQIAGQPLGAGAAEEMELQLSPREMSVLLLLGEGRRAVEIAADLSLSIHTVRDHIKEILAKLNADSQLKAVLNAQRLGLLALPTERNA